jgi:hypothetical protein
MRWAVAPSVAPTSGLALNVTSVIKGIQVSSSGDDAIVKNSRLLLDAIPPVFDPLEPGGKEKEAPLRS